MLFRVISLENTRGISKMDVPSLDRVNHSSESLRALRELEADTDVQILQGAQVIGMTSTGAAKYKHLYEKLNIEVVIVEEAAELLEAHIVTSISASTKQLILIGR